MKNRLFTISLFVMCITNTTFSQQDSTRKFIGPETQLSFVYPISTNGLNSPSISNSYSFNLIYGVNGGLNGLELGGIANINRGSVNGVQLAGMLNVTDSSANGLILSGIANVSNDSSKSVSLAGIANIANGSHFGVQGAGLSNSIHGNLYGIQTAGILNSTTGSVIGIQTAGISNHSESIQGLQVGLINHSKKVKGFQIGLINIADTYEKGLPIGLINFVKDGYHAIELSTTEAVYANFAVKLGVDKFYGVYKVGYFTNTNSEHAYYGLGFGTKLNLTDKFKLSVDITENQILEKDYTSSLNFLSKLDIALRYNVGNHLDFFVGPSFNVLISESLINSENLPINPPYTIYKQNWDSYSASTSFWIGGNAGLSFRF